MTDIINQNAEVSASSSIPVSDVTLRQQEAVTPDSGGRSTASCSTAQFAAAATTITIPVRIMRLPEVMARVGLKRASIYQHIAAGSFPRQIVLGVRAVGWLESEIDAWLTVRINARQFPKA